MKRDKKQYFNHKETAASVKERPIIPEDNAKHNSRISYQRSGSFAVQTRVSSLEELSREIVLKQKAAVTGIASCRFGEISFQEIGNNCSYEESDEERLVLRIPLYPYHPQTVTHMGDVADALYATQFRSFEWLKEIANMLENQKLVSDALESMKGKVQFERENEEAKEFFKKAVFK